MQLRSSLLGALLGLLVTNRGYASDTVVQKTQLYVDDNRTVVVSPLVSATKDVWRGGTIGAMYVADVISSASVDVVTNATGRIHDFRSEGTGSFVQQVGASTWSGSYILSSENDYQSHNGNLGYARDLFEKNSTVAVGYGFSHHTIERYGDRAFSRQQTVHAPSVTWTQNLDPKTALQLGYSLMVHDGYQASPYRFVRVQAADEDRIRFKVPETVPNDRVRHAVVVGLNRHLFTDSAFQADARYYVDSWSIASTTVQMRYLVNFGEALSLRLRTRLYAQERARFFAPRYTGVAPFMTADRELSTFASALGGAKVVWHALRKSFALDLEAKADLFAMKYVDFAFLGSRLGANLEAGMSVVY